MTPQFQCKILFHIKNEDVCKKLELYIFKNDWAMAKLSLEKENFEISEKLAQLKNFWDIVETFFLLMVTDGPL